MASPSRITVSPGRAVTGVPAAPLRMDGGNEWILKKIGVGGLAQDKLRRRLSNYQVIETGRGGCTRRFKGRSMRRQTKVSERNGPD